MASASYNVIKKLTVSDDCFVEIVARHDGMFQYFGWEHEDYDGPGRFHPTVNSGLFSTLQDAEAEARIAFKL